MVLSLSEYDQIFMLTNEGGVVVLDRSKRGSWVMIASEPVIIENGFIMIMTDDAVLEVPMRVRGRVVLGPGDTLTVTAG